MLQLNIPFDDLGTAFDASEIGYRHIPRSMTMAPRIHDWPCKCD